MVNIHIHGPRLRVLLMVPGFPWLHASRWLPSLGTCSGSDQHVILARNVYRVLGLLKLSWWIILDRIVLAEFEADAVDTMPLVGRCRVALALEDMAQMAAAVRTDNLRAGHAQRAIGVARHRAGNGIEEGGPAAAGFELVARLVEGRTTSGAVIDARRGHMLVVFPGIWGLGALLSEHAELFFAQYRSPLIITLFDRVRHVLVRG